MKFESLVTQLTDSIAPSGELSVPMASPGNFYDNPLAPLLEDKDITEIIITGKNNIWFEKSGQFYQHTTHFASNISFSNFVHLLADHAGIQTNHRAPFANGEWSGFRVHLASPPICQEHSITLRRLKPYSLSLEDLQRTSWCSEVALHHLKKIVFERKNILVVGSTGSGKTTLLNSLILETKNQRCVYIEDTAELVLNSPLSTRLLTRFDATGSLPNVDQTDLVKQSLRMRPDRLILGEVRGGEAKDLLLALSTGHHGSMASLHAGSAQEALMRLEMLVLMGAPEWNLLTIRRLIHHSIHALVVTEKYLNGWRLKSIQKISSLEEFGFTFEELAL